MQQFSLYQIHLTAEERAEANEMGRGRALLEMPIIEAQLATSMGGVEAMLPEYEQFYTLVSVITARDLEDAFYVHNNPHGLPELEEQIERFSMQHSMSVGDIVITESGKAMMVDSFGFGEIEIDALGPDAYAA